MTSFLIKGYTIWSILIYHYMCCILLAKTSSKLYAIFILQSCTSFYFSEHGVVHQQYRNFFKWFKKKIRKFIENINGWNHIQNIWTWWMVSGFIAVTNWCICVVVMTQLWIILIEVIIWLENVFRNITHCSIFNPLLLQLKSKEQTEIHLFIHL